MHLCRLNGSVVELHKFSQLQCTCSSRALMRVFTNIHAHIRYPLWLDQRCNERQQCMLHANCGFPSCNSVRCRSLHTTVLSCYMYASDLTLFSTLLSTPVGAARRSWGHRLCDNYGANCPGYHLTPAPVVRVFADDEREEYKNSHGPNFWHGPGPASEAGADE